jgi:hypothetical protein
MSQTVNASKAALSPFQASMNGRNKAPGYEIWKAMSAGHPDVP